MKSWALFLIVAAFVSIPAHKAEAKKAPKRHVVVVSFTESDIKQANRAPASVDDQKELAAEQRHMARLAEANVTIPEF